MLRFAGLQKMGNMLAGCRCVGLGAKYQGFRWMWNGPLYRAKKMLVGCYCSAVPGEVA